MNNFFNVSMDDIIQKQNLVKWRDSTKKKKLFLSYTEIITLCKNLQKLLQHSVEKSFVEGKHEITFKLSWQPGHRIN